MILALSASSCPVTCNTTVTVCVWSFSKRNEHVHTFTWNHWHLFLFSVKKNYNKKPLSPAPNPHFCAPPLPRPFLLPPLPPPDTLCTHWPVSQTTAHIPVCHDDHRNLFPGILSVVGQSMLVSYFLCDVFVSHKSWVYNNELEFAKSMSCVQI